jgi:hypothetical protein
VAIFTHGGPISLIFDEILHKNVSNIDDCAYAQLAVDDQGTKIVSSSGISFVK